MTAVPTYALYGEADRPLLQDSLHCESIALRSRVHDWEIRPHRHDLFAQLLHIRHGSGEAILNGAAVAMTGPCLVFVPPLSPHGFNFSSDVDGRVITLVAQQLHARLAAVPELRPAFEAAACRLLAPGSAQATQLDTVLAAVVNEFQGHAPWRSSAIDAALTLALLVVGRTLAPTPRPEEGVVSSRGRRHVQRFLADVELGFREPRTIESYAAPLGITATQLNRLCRQLLGRSALQTVHARARLEAERDLAYTSLSIKEIALGLGFTDAAYFTRFFMRERGTSPSDYRKAVREEMGRLGEGGATRGPAANMPAMDAVSSPTSS